MTKDLEPICIATYRVQSERMQRLRYAPVTLGGLAAMLNVRGIELYADLTARFNEVAVRRGSGDLADQRPVSPSS